MAENEHMNQTILKMLKDLRETGGNRLIEDDKTPLKRSSSPASSLEDIRTPIKRIKRESLDACYVGSPREFRRLRADLIEARNLNLNLEHQISQMHALRKQTQAMFDNEIESLKKQHEYDRKSIEELEDHLQCVKKREAALKAELSEIKSSYNSLKFASEENILTLENQMHHLKDECQTTALEDSIEVSRLKRQISELECMLEAAQQDAEAQKMLATELGKELSKKNAIENELDIKEVALAKAKSQIRLLENAKENYMEFQQQAKTQAHKLAKYAELEKENEQLREDFERLKGGLKNKLLLEEEVRDLKKRVEKNKELDKTAAELQAQCEQNQRFLAEWKAVARGFCETTESDAMLPHLLRTAIERLQQQELSLVAEKVDYETQLKSAQHAAKVAKMELEKNQKLVADLKLTSSKKQMLIHRIQKKLLLVSRERDSYRMQLDTYERDLTIANATSIEASASSDSAQNQKERIDNLEKIIEGYRDMVAKLENDLQAAEPQLYTEVVPIRQEQISRLQDEVAKLREENEFIREQRDRLEVQLENLSEGNDTLLGGQVVHPTNNPLSECLAQRHHNLEQLQEENMRLKNKLKKMEEGIETSKLGDVSVCPQEVLSLREQIKNNEKQAQMLKDYFKSSMQDFRNVIYMLFGFKIDRPSNSSIYKLRSRYAEHQEDILCFEISPEGDLNLLENEFSANLTELINLHLFHQKSIPVFLSALTMDLFQQRTMTQAYGN